MCHNRRLAAVWLLAVVLTGCATNSLTVTEHTEDGYSFSVHQVTRSTWGSKTEEGSGAVSYSGDGFDFHAGSAVVGQQSQDPAASFRAVLEFMQSITAPLAAP